MKKKLFALLLSTFLLVGCTTTTPKKKKKKSTSEETVTEVTKVSFNREEINFNLNDEHRYTVETIIVTVEGEGDFDASLTWSSSDESVAQVEDGVVNGLKIGTAVITAVSNFDNDKYATCNITVINDVPVVESVSITPEQPTIDLYTGSSVQLTATVHGTNSPSQAVTWDAQSSNVLSVDGNGKVTATKTGSGTVTATSVENPLKSCSVTVNVIDSTPSVEKVEIQPTASSYQLDLYEPNNKKTKQFSAKVTVKNGASEEVSWSSSDPSKVSVSSDGLVTALQVTGVSTVVITATSKFDSSKTDTVGISVIDSTPRVSSVTVSLSTSSIKVGSTTTATATVLGTNITADQKKVTWSSSNSNIADVNPTTGVITGKAVGGPVTITATSTFDSSKTGSKTITVTEAGSLDAYTVMIYMCGSDLESGSQHFASADIAEILSAQNKQPDDVNIIIETGGAESWGNSKISADYLTRWEVRDGELVEKSKLANANMSDGKTFQSFVEWGLSNYPAEKMGLVFWDHGGGLAGCCLDEIYGIGGSYFSPTYDFLTPVEVRDAMVNSLSKSDIEKFEWIGYDCCLMQTIEISVANSAYANYQVASQISEWGGGWDYTPWVDQLFANPDVATSSLLTTICDSFVAYYDDEGSSNVMTLSWLDLSKANTFVEAFNQFTKGCTYSNVNGKISQTLTFDSDYDCYDLGNLLTALGATSDSTVQKTLSQLVGYKCYRNNASCNESGFNISYKTYKPSGTNIFIAKSRDVDESIYEGIASGVFGDWYTMNINRY